MNYPINLLYKLKNINVGEACRICITGKKCLRELQLTKISKIIECCASIKISDNDGLPQKICSTCFHMISKIYTFRKRIERNDKIWRSFLSNKCIENQHKDMINIALEKANIEDITPVECLDIKYVNADFISKPASLQIITESLPPLIPISSGKISADQQPSKILSENALPLISTSVTPIINTEMFANVIPKLEYTCYICSKKFKDISELNEHKLNKCKPRKLQCNVCLKEFNESKKLIGHLKGHVVVKDYLCKICGKKYPNYSTFIVHMRSHTGERPFKCTVCQKGFVRWANVKLHMRTHEENRPFACDMCPKAFKVSSNLERHKRTHFGIEPYTCDYCRKTYSQQENLKMHIFTYHTNERPFLCNFCGKGFVNSTRLNRHMWTHNGTKPYKCCLCPKAYLNLIDLKNHENQHSGKNVNELKNYSCNKCNKKFFHPCRLEKHKKVHEKGRTCRVCQKVLFSQISYKKHLREEHGYTESEDDLFLVYEEVEIPSESVKDALC